MDNCLTNEHERILSGSLFAHSRPIDFLHLILGKDKGHFLQLKYHKTTPVYHGAFQEGQNPIVTTTMGTKNIV